MSNILNKILFFKRGKFFIFLSFFLILGITTVNIVDAANITISPTTSGGLWEAIETAESGSTIYLENGIYTGENNLEININKNIVIKGKGENVVIDGENKYSYLFQMVKHDSVSKTYIPISVQIANLKVKNFHGDVIENWGSLKVNNCTFSDNKISGAIIYNYNGSNCKIANSVFTKNTFVYNKSDGAAGIVIYTYNVTSFSVTGSTFSNFKSTSHSIGVAIQNFISTNVLVSKCKFINTGKKYEYYL